MSKNNAKKHSPRKPRPSELAAKAAREAQKATPKRSVGRPPTERKAFDKTTMVRMFAEDYAAFEAAARKMAAKNGSPVSVGAFLRMAGRAVLEANR
jgi:hypothetical protein